MADGQQLNELDFIGSLSDNDLLIMEDVSDPLPLKKIRLSSIRSALVGGWPSLEDTPEGAVTPPIWILEGIEGGWRIHIKNTVTDATWFFIYKLNYDTGLYDVVYALAEHRDPIYTSPPYKNPLYYDYLAEITDPPGRFYGTFKVQSVSADFQGPLSDPKSAWTDYRVPSDWLPDAPTLLTTGGYPLISYAPLPDGGLGYTISIKIQAPAGQKNLVKEYVIVRVSDEGTGSFDGRTAKINNLTIKAEPRPKIVIWNDTDRSFVPGHKYQYLVAVRAFNNKIGPGSNLQDVTLTDDTTAPDDPVFTVKTSPGNIEVTFDPIEVGGNPDVGWAYIQLQFRIDGGDWTDVILDKTLSFIFSVAEADYADVYEFQAKVFDYAGNENVGGWQTDPASYTAGKITELTFGTDLYNKVQKIEINEGNITTHETEITQNADAIVLRALKTYVDGGTILGAITVNAGNIDLRVEKDDISNQINITAQGVRIAGIELAIDANTTFAADVEIQGILKASGGIKTSTGTQRIEIGKYGAADSISWFHSNIKRVKIEGTAIDFLDASSVLKVSISSNSIEVASPAFIFCGGYIRTDDIYKVGANQVVAARGAAIANPTDAATTMARLIDLLAHFRTWGSIAT